MVALSFACFAVAHRHASRFLLVILFYLEWFRDCSTVAERVGFLPSVLLYELQEHSLNEGLTATFVHNLSWLRLHRLLRREHDIEVNVHAVILASI